MNIARALIPAIVLACLGAIAIVLATSRGPGVSPDSIAYLSAAHAIAEGRGVMTIDGERRVPLTHFPPLLPLVASTGAVVGADPAAWLRILHCVLFAVLVIVAARMTRPQRDFAWSGAIGATLTAAVLVASKELVAAFSMVWSEPLFLTLMLAWLFTLASYLSGAKTRQLVFAALLAASAFMTRYAGVSLIAASAIALLLSPRRPWPRRFRDLALFLAVAASPMLLWSIRNVMLAGNATARPLMLHPLDWGTYLGGAGELWKLLTHDRNWFVLHRLPRNLQMVAAVSFTLAFVIAGLLRFRRIEERRTPIEPLLAMFIVVHLAAMSIAGALQDRSVVFDARLLMPTYVCGVILVVTQLMRWTAPRRSLRVALLMIVGIWVAVGMRDVARWAGHARNEGILYSSRAWTGSRLVERVRHLPRDQRIFTNAEDALYYLTGRAGARLPWRFEPVSGVVNERFAFQVQALPRQLGNGVIVYFDTVPWRRYAPTREELAGVRGLREIAREADGSIYVAE